MANIVQTASRCRLDFDDAYQCVAAEKHVRLSSALIRISTGPSEAGKRPRVCSRSYREIPENRRDES